MLRRGGRSVIDMACSSTIYLSALLQIITASGRSVLTPEAEARVDSVLETATFAAIGAAAHIGQYHVIGAVGGAGGGGTGVGGGSGNDGYTSFCETETFHGACASDEVIVITHARYGRMRISRCVKLDYGHLGCVADVIELADSRCSGRRRCEIRIPDSELAKFKPCPDDLKPYMEIGYKCVKVETSKDFCIYPRSTQVVSTQGRGYLASLVTEMTGCGGLTTPWIISVNPGQVIQLTLYDFGVARAKRGMLVGGAVGSPPSRSSFVQCQTYAVLRETVPDSSSSPSSSIYGEGSQWIGGSMGSRHHRLTKNVTVCGGVLRKSVVYTTLSNRLEIGLVRNDHLIYGPHYMFEYEAVGCADLASIPNAWQTRTGDSLTVNCNNSKDIFQLSCHDGGWTGDPVNCSAAPFISLNMEKLSKTGISIPYGLSLLIILIIALAIGTFVLCAGLMFLKRRGGINACAPATRDTKQYVVTSSLVRNLDGSSVLHTSPMDKLSWGRQPAQAGVDGHGTYGVGSLYGRTSIGPSTPSCYTASPYSGCDGSRVGILGSLSPYLNRVAALNLTSTPRSPLLANRIGLYQQSPLYCTSPRRPVQLIEQTLPCGCRALTTDGTTSPSEQCGEKCCCPMSSYTVRTARCSEGDAREETRGGDVGDEGAEVEEDEGQEDDECDRYGVDGTVTSTKGEFIKNDGNDDDGDQSATSSSSPSSVYFVLDTSSRVNAHASQMTSFSRNVWTSPRRGDPETSPAHRVNAYLSSTVNNRPEFMPDVQNGNVDNYSLRSPIPIRCNLTEGCDRLSSDGKDDGRTISSQRTTVTEPATLVASATLVARRDSEDAFDCSTISVPELVSDCSNHGSVMISPEREAHCNANMMSDSAI